MDGEPIDQARRRRNALIGFFGLLAAGALFLGGFWLAQRGAEEGPWLTFKREGGIVGHTDSVTLTEDGEARLTRAEGEAETSYDVPEDLMDRVRDAVDEIDWEEVQGPPAEPECCDLIYYTIRFDDRIAYVSDITRGSEELDRLVGLLAEVLDEAPA